MKPTNTMSGSKKIANTARIANGLVALTFGALTLAAANVALAQEGPYVRIEIPKSNVAVEGVLVDFDDELFFIDGQLGVLRVKREDAICIGVGCPDGVVSAATPTTSAREVVLKTNDGGTTLKGELVASDTTHYTIRNRLGEFRIHKSDVVCEGSACPDSEIHDAQFAVHAATPEVLLLIADMLGGYANANGQNYEVDLSDGIPEKIRLLSNGTQKVVAEATLILESSRAALQALSGNVPDIAVLDLQQFNSQLPLVKDVNLDALERALIAYDGLVIVGNPANPVRDLTTLEVSNILSGTVSSWRSLGGGDFPISMHIVSEDATTGPDAELWLSSFGQSVAGDIIRHASDAAVLEAVDLDRNAIGLVHRATAPKHHAKMLDLRKACGLTTSPTNFDMQIGQYPATNPVYAFGRSSGIHPVAASFVAWMQTPEAQQLTGRSGFVGTQLQRERMEDLGVAVIHTAAEEPDFDGAEFSSMMRELRDADRLSIVFRFLPGSATLDEASRQNVKDLAGRLRRSEFDGQEVLMVGFADSIGPADRNTVLSGRRAQAVLDVLKAEFDNETLARLNLQSLSFGEQMPLDCNETDDGRANNRRVEVWVRTAS